MNCRADDFKVSWFSYSLPHAEPDGDDEMDDDSLGNLPDTENSDGIRRGGADVMGSRQEGVRVDEIATLEEGAFLCRSLCLLYLTFDPNR